MLQPATTDQEGPMHITDVPASRPTEISSEATPLATALGEIQVKYTCYDILRGAPCSGRILLAVPIRDSRLDLVTFPEAYTPLEVAEQLLALGDQARRAPAIAPHEKMKLGWEIRRSLFCKRTVALAFAVWC